MGALVNKWTHVNIPLVVSTITGQDGQTRVTTVQTILDQLMPGTGTAAVNLRLYVAAA